jgi:hypothetical protein
MSYQGLFKPKYPQKYKGNPTNIIYRSSYELKLMSHLDKNPNVLQWASEEFFVPYKSPIDGKIHRYFPDFWVKKKNRDGITETIVIEVKPRSQTIPPTPRTHITKQYLYEVQTWGINQAKWEAANKYCISKDWKFMIVTEKELGIVIR